MCWVGICTRHYTTATRGCCGCRHASSTCCGVATIVIADLVHTEVVSGELQLVEQRLIFLITAASTVASAIAIWPCFSAQGRFLCSTSRTSSST